MPEVTDPNLLAMLNGGGAPRGGPISSGVKPVAAATPLQMSAEQRAIEDQDAQRRKDAIQAQKDAQTIQENAKKLADGDVATAVGEERKAGAFLIRALGANKSYEGLDIGPRSMVGQTASEIAPNALNSIWGPVGNSPSRQISDTNQDEFIAASLRQDSGAAIPEEEMDRQRRIYFPMPGDGELVIEAKKQARLRSIEGLKQSSGKLLEETMARYEAMGQGDEQKDDEVELIEFETNPDLAVGMDGKVRNIKTGEIINLDSPPDDTGPSIGESLYAGVGDVAEFAGDTLGLIANPLNAGINAVTGTDLGTDLGQTFRDATGAPDGNATATAINKGGLSALTGVGIGNALRGAQGATGAVANALSSQPVQQTVAGATAGASADIARQSGASVPVQVAAGIAGGLGGFSGTNALMNAGRATAKAAPNALVADAQRVKVPLMTTDAIPPRTAIGKTARKTGELIPIAGTGGPRVKQQAARVDAVKQLAREYDFDESSLDDITKDLTSTRSKQITHFDGQKKQILKNVTGPAPAPRAIAKLDEQIIAASKVKTPASQSLVEKLNGFKTGLQNGNNTLTELEAIRKEMGTAFKDPSLANIADAGRKALKSVYNPLRDDMAATIRAAGGDEAAKTWRIANARLSGLADELQSTALKSTLNKAASTPEDVAKLLFSTKPSQVRLLYNNLSAEGRVKAQGALIGKAMEKAGGKSTDDLSPDDFANEIDRLSKSVGVFFQDSDLARVNGLNRVLQATKRAGQAGVVPDNGAQVLPWAMPAAVTSLFASFGGATSGAAVGGFGVGAGLLARLYESAGVRNALLKLGRTKPGSPQERSVVPSVMAAIIAANDNPQIAQYMKDAPGLTKAVAGDEVGEERPVKP